MASSRRPVMRTPPARRRLLSARSPPRARPPRSAARTLTSVEGTSVSVPPSTTRSTAGPESAHDLVRRQWRRRAVRVGAGDQEDPGLAQQRAQEVVVGDAHRHLVTADQPRRPGADRRRSRRPG